tara:strand:+ start:2374 stop:2529 length:156 start_codon:yes stop_codon:yes gene_type:complete
MTFESGILMFFIGMTITIVGFFVAYMIANRHIEKQKQEKEEKKKNYNLFNI